jgi:LuxR family maltose regulon positive regulatory protein
MLDAKIGRNTLALMRTPVLPSIEAILTLLINEIAAFPDYFAIVLDDYHVIDSKPDDEATSIDEALTFLLEHMPPQMHLVVASREDPNLPLARLRAGDQLTELRAGDLRFTSAEACTFLNQTMSLDLSAEDITALETRTEGWIAGLQLAALSMRGREDIPGFVEAFAGDNRYIVDYLVEEVLQRQPALIRSFLLETSILDRLSGPLCEAVTGQENGQARLESLERGNFFVVPLDDRRRWYRYHHLFAEVLYARLLAEQPEQATILHHRASEWHELEGSAADAIRHALAAEDFNRAADLVERAMPDMRRSRQEATLLGWLQALPDELVHTRPVLGVMYALILLASGELEGVEERLRDAERRLNTTIDVSGQPDDPTHAMIVTADEELRRLPGTIAIARAGLALAGGDVPGTVNCARQALDLAPEDDHLTRGGAEGFLGLAFWTSGDLETAHRTYADGMASLKKAGNISDAINGAIALAAIRMAQGRMREAMSTYEWGLQLAAEQGAPVVRGPADIHVGMSEGLREWNDLRSAMLHLQRSEELGEHKGLPQNRYRWRVAMARIREAQGDLDGALDLLDEAERLYMSDFSPNVRPIAALKIRVRVAQGRLDEAIDWAHEQGLSAHADLGYLREFEQITLARVLLAISQIGREEQPILEAMGLLERLFQAAEEGERTGSVIEILVLQALAHQMQGDIAPALVRLERALMLAEPEGYVRIFLDEGLPMAILLENAAKQSIMPVYVHRLLSAFGRGEDRTFPRQALIDPLSDRELEILRLFKTELSGPEIARVLVIALSTVRTHTKKIFGKLNVNNRRAAVKRAEELNLI